MGLLVYYSEFYKSMWSAGSKPDAHIYSKDKVDENSPILTIQTTVPVVSEEIFYTFLEAPKQDSIGKACLFVMAFSFIS